MWELLEWVFLAWIHIHNSRILFSLRMDVGRIVQCSELSVYSLYCVLNTHHSCGPPWDCSLYVEQTPLGITPDNLLIYSWVYFKRLSSCFLASHSTCHFLPLEYSSRELSLSYWPWFAMCLWVAMGSWLSAEIPSFNSPLESFSFRSRLNIYPLPWSEMKHR